MGPLHALRDAIWVLGDELVEHVRLIRSSSFTLRSACDVPRGFVGAGDQS